MKLSLSLLTLCVALGPIAEAKKKPVWQRATVLSQDRSSSRAGAYAAPIGSGTVAIPLYRTSNHVVVETETHWLEWSEVGSPQIVLPVNGVVDFYMDDKWFIVLDAKKKKHKFALVGMTLRAAKQ
jgi:hypothetical protein